MVARIFLPYKSCTFLARCYIFLSNGTDELIRDNSATVDGGTVLFCKQRANRKIVLDLETANVSVTSDFMYIILVLVRLHQPLDLLLLRHHH